MKGLIKGSNGSVSNMEKPLRKYKGRDFISHEYFSALSAISAVSWNFLRSGGFKLFFPLADDRIFSVFSAPSAPQRSLSVLDQRTPSPNLGRGENRMEPGHFSWFMVSRREMNNCGEKSGSRRGAKGAKMKLIGSDCCPN
jgi:hypothetical protein